MQMTLCYWLKKKRCYRAWTERLMEIGRYYGMEKKVKKKTTVMRISKQLSQIQIMIDKNNWRMWITSTIWEA
jgi:hypothetical protein